MQAAPSWASLLESDSEAPRGRREPGIGPWARSTRRRRRAKRMLETFFADLDLASQALLLFWSGNAVKAQVPNELGNRCARCTVPYHAAAPATSAHASAMLLRRPPRCAWGAPVHVSRPLNVQQEFGLPRVCPCAILYHPGPRTRTRPPSGRRPQAASELVGRLGHGSPLHTRGRCTAAVAMAHGFALSAFSRACSKRALGQSQICRRLI